MRTTRNGAGPASRSCRITGSSASHSWYCSCRILAGSRRHARQTRYSPARSAYLSPLIAHLPGQAASAAWHAPAPGRKLGEFQPGHLDAFAGQVVVPPRPLTVLARGFPRGGHQPTCLQPGQQRVQSAAGQPGRLHQVIAIPPGGGIIQEDPEHPFQGRGHPHKPLSYIYRLATPAATRTRLRSRLRSGAAIPDASGRWRPGILSVTWNRPSPPAGAVGQGQFGAANRHEAVQMARPRGWI